jgi:3-hydroxyacyl-CoA dehydrogenase/3a,7a,12a-trihydroxy-5b-cholest-24-enoyl-CoA hydratase
MSSSSSSSSLTYRGRVVLVTGGSGSIGSAYCRYFAKLGASVFINDIIPKGKNENDAPAQLLVNEILSSGGVAAANFTSVTAPNGGSQIISACIAKFGRLDVLINNAGILRDVSFGKIKAEDWDIIDQIHVRAAFSLTKAAWEVFKRQSYGRILMTSSASGLYGNFGQTNYSAAKMALVGFGFALAKEGAKSNIYCNIVAPWAGSPLTATVMSKEMVETLKPDYMAPIVAYICHELSGINGQVFELGGGWVSRVRWQRSSGLGFPLTDDFTSLNGISLVQQQWKQIEDFSNSDYPSGNAEAFAHILKNIEKSRPGSSQAVATAKNPGKAMGDAAAKAAATTSSNSSLKANQFFSDMKIFATTEAGQAVAKKQNAIFIFQITGENKEKECFALDFKSSPPSVVQGSQAEQLKADVSFALSDSDFLALVQKKANPQALFMSGKLKLKGNMQLAMKFGEILKALPKAKL